MAVSMMVMCFIVLVHVIMDFFFIDLPIDFSINSLSTETSLRSQRTPKPYKIKLNTCKLISLVIRIELMSNLNAMIPKFSEKFDHPFSHVCIFENIFPEGHGFGALPVTSRFIVTYSNLSLSN